MAERGSGEMTLTADQYFQISQGYAKAAEDPYVSPVSRDVFAKKAEWFDFLGRREGRALHSDGIDGRGGSVPTARAFVDEPGLSEHAGRSMKPLVTTLCLIGVALYLIGTVLFTNALNLFGEDDRQVASQVTLSLGLAPKVTSVAKATEPGERQLQLTADRPRAISTVPHSLAHQKELGFPSPPPEPIEDVVAVPPREILKVTANARIRNGPSTSAGKIGTAIRGTAIQVKAREGAWVQFVDSSSGKIGWIHSSLVVRRDATLP